MFFILLLATTTLSIAASAAFFSIYGLMELFRGISLYVLIMGVSLEAGKLIAASYLYRYWSRTTFLLKVYMMSGVLMLMVLTSTGIFGLLSAGYQTDVLPLKQMQEKIALFEQEKARLADRKLQIDSQIEKLPANYVTARKQLMDKFAPEQVKITSRIDELDALILDHTTKFTEQQAHIGPITYIASVFGLDTDNATKYLIFLIIFAFDPMAVALTLATNIAIRQREEEKKLAIEQAPTIPQDDQSLTTHVTEPLQVDQEQLIAAVLSAISLQQHQEASHSEEAPDPFAVAQKIIDSSQPVQVESEENLTPVGETKEEQADHRLSSMSTEPEQPPAEPPVESPQQKLFQEDLFSQDAQQPPPEPQELPRYAAHRRVRPYAKAAPDLRDDKIHDLIYHYRWLKSQPTHTNDDKWELEAIEDFLTKKGMDNYLQT